MAGTSELRDLDTRMAERRLRGARVFADSAGIPARSDRPEQPFRNPLGWLLTVSASLMVALVGAVAMIVVPAGLACREQSARGFFSGDGVTACLGRTVPARFQAFEGRLRRAILNSGQ